MKKRLVGTALFGVALCFLATGADAPTPDRGSADTSGASGSVERLGELKFVLGEDKTSLQSRFDGQFVIEEGEPDTHVRTRTVCTVRGKGAGAKAVGELIFRDGKLATVGQDIGKYEGTDSGALVNDLIENLEELDEMTEAPIRVRWDKGVIGGEKSGNTRLSFWSGNRVVQLIYSDTEHGNKDVYLHRYVGRNP
ncbi:MAG: hypothetical protein IT365_07790 [Candidatus Hydrogenedentes bacterium]|nr:hypothetical protein [Candidatus Hydrogenedentota bacterium]